MPISSSAYARRPVLPRPISMSVTIYLLPAAVVRRLDRHLHVVRVAFLQASGRDLDESGVLQLGDGARAAVSHGHAQPAYQLVGDGGERPAIGNLSLDALRDQLVLAQHVVLEVPVLGVGLTPLPVAHRAEGAHAAVGLVLLAVDEDHLARALLTAGQQAAEHHGVRAGRDRLGYVAGVLQAAVADDRDSGRAGRQRRLVDRAHLRDADAGDDPGGADRARSDTHLHAVRSGVDERLRPGPGRHVAADHLDVAVRLELRDHVEDRLRVAVRGVHHEEVNPRVDERLGAALGVLADAHGSPDDESPAGVLGGAGELLALG